MIVLQRLNTCSLRPTCENEESGDSNLFLPRLVYYRIRLSVLVRAKLDVGPLILSSSVSVLAVYSSLTLFVLFLPRLAA